MFVVATAGHVDHGKSTLVRALTGTDPDRLAVETARGLTVDLGFATTELPGGRRLALVDVPGHRRFVPTMLAGVGPVPAVLLAVAADDGWMPQTQEHLDALTGLGVDRGVLAVTRSDLFDPELAEEEARTALAGTALADMPAVAVSAHTGAGLPALRAALAELGDGLPAADPLADVRLWVDRAFTVDGVGTVVTGTLPAGRLHRGDRLQIDGTGPAVTVRGLQVFGQPVEAVDAIARVAINLRGADPDRLGRGTALTSPDAWAPTRLVDLHLMPAPGQNGPDRPAAQMIVHCGSGAVPARVRPLGDEHVRIRMDRVLPLRPGDRLLLRDPGSRTIRGAQVLDPAPTPLSRRGDARRRADALAAAPTRPDGGAELARRTVMSADLLRRLGATPPTGAIAHGPWLLDGTAVPGLARRLAAAVRDHARRFPLDAGLPVEAARQSLELPAVGLVEALLTDPAAADTVAESGRLLPAERVGRVPAAVQPALDELVRRWAHDPFAAPTAAELTELGLDRARLAAGVRAQALTALAPGVFLGPEAVDRAAAALAQVPAPFTVSRARQEWNTSRRVAVPLLEALAGRGLTVIDAEGRHRLV